MTSSLGFVLWGNVAGLTLAFAISHDWSLIQFLILFIVTIRGTSDLFSKVTVCGWVCIFCGKPGMGTIWQAVTTICNHE